QEVAARPLVQQAIELVELAVLVPVGPHLSSLLLAWPSTASSGLALRGLWGRPGTTVKGWIGSAIGVPARWRGTRQAPGHGAAPLRSRSHPVQPGPGGRWRRPRDGRRGEPGCPADRRDDGAERGVGRDQPGRAPRLLVSFS